MKELLTLSLLCISSLIYAQVEWNAYKETDNTIKNLFLQSTNSFSTNSENTIDDVFGGAIIGFYSSRKVKELSITNFSFKNQLTYNYSDFSLTRNKNFEFNLSHSHYLKERRGLFLQGNITSNYLLFGDRLLAGNFTDGHTASIHLGYGRMENISRVYQAIRINKIIFDNPPNLEKVFWLANKLSQINFNDILNNKSIDAEKKESFLSELESNGYDLSSLNNLSTILNNFIFETPNVLRQGKFISIGFGEYRSFKTGSNSRSVVLNLEYATAINDKWHFDARSGINYQLSSNSKPIFNLRTQLNYIPSALTKISVANNLNFLRSKTINNLSNSIGVGAAYSVAQNISIFAGIGLFTEIIWSSSAGTLYGAGNSQSFSSSLSLRVAI